MAKEYILDSATDLGREQLAYSRRLFDPVTTGFLEPVGVQPGWRCLDLGAGSGSIANWLADRTGAAGRVVAVDIDTDHLIAQPGVEVLRHDINDGVPPGGPFDLIHARLLLVHLKRREQVFSDLVDALAPGGWLVIGDCSDRPQHVLAAPSEADKELVERVTDTALKTVRAAGVSWEWAHEVDGQMAAAGMANIQGLEYCRAMRGGTDECLLNDNYVKQAEPMFLSAGLRRDELERFHSVMRDPRFRAWPWLQLVYTRGQKPAEPIGPRGSVA